MTFNDLKLIPALLRAVKEQGYTEPSPIQRATIPIVLDGRDLIGCAQTGTGKTAAFALPILQRLADKTGRRPRALILTPTRELAIQIDESFAAYGRHLPLRHAVIFGGVGQQPQVNALTRGVDILTATPGRFNDLMGQGFIDLSELQIFVLDEADRMLDMGFIHDVRRVIRSLPPRRQNLLFSATMPPEIEELAGTLLTDPQTVKVDPVTSTVDAIDQSVYLVDKGNKKHLLAKLLAGSDVRSALVFTRTKHGADRVVRELSRAGIESRAIHGNKSQTARQDAIKGFKAGRIRVLVATDIAARGIDVPELSHVINYDLPHEPETYIHRIGRTGRAGLSGIAVSFCCIDEMDDLKSIEKLIGLKIPRLESEWPMQVFQKSEKKQPQPRPGRGGQPAKPSSQGNTSKTANPSVALHDNTLVTAKEAGEVKPAPSDPRREQDKAVPGQGESKNAAKPKANATASDAPRPDTQNPQKAENSRKQTAASGPIASPPVRRSHRATVNPPAPPPPPAVTRASAILPRCSTRWHPAPRAAVSFRQASCTAASTLAAPTATFLLPRRPRPTVRPRWTPHAAPRCSPPAPFRAAARSRKMLPIPTVGAALAAADGFALTRCKKGEIA